MIGTNVGLRLITTGAVSTSTSGPPTPEPAILPHTATARWHPHFSQVTENAGRVVSATDLSGLASATQGAIGAGPQALSDGQGRRFWRFEGDAFLNIAGALALSSRDMAAFMVVRQGRPSAAYTRFMSLGNRAQGSQANTLGGPLESRVVAKSTGHVQAFGRLATTAPAGAQWLVPGAQKQVIGMTSSSAGQRLFLNERFVDVGKAYPVTNVPGAEIGRYAYSPGASGSWGVFDTYEIIVYDAALSPAEALSVSQALMTSHDIVPVTNQLVLDGDSITQGTGEVTKQLSAGMILTEPGAGHLPPNWRVVNLANSGNVVSQLTTKRDDANGWAAQILPGGQNVLAFEIGRNDWAGTTTAQQHYANVVSYLNTPTTGVLQRGWHVRAMANIAASSPFAPYVDAHRAALRDPQFLTDTLSAPGQSFAGKVSVVETDLIEHDGAQRFADANDAGNTVYYAGDSTHPSLLGTQIRVTGGDTPQYGLAAGLGA